jgi:hypothetical protein
MVPQLRYQGPHLITRIDETAVPRLQIWDFMVCFFNACGARARDIEEVLTCNLTCPPQALLIIQRRHATYFAHVFSSSDYWRGTLAGGVPMDASLQMHTFNAVLCTPGLGAELQAAVCIVRVSGLARGFLLDAAPLDAAARAVDTGLAAELVRLAKPRPALPDVELLDCEGAQLFWICRADCALIAGTLTLCSRASLGDQFYSPF